MSLLLPEKLPESIDKAVSNVAEKPTKEVGDIFNDLLYLIFGNMHYYVEKRRIEHHFALEEFKKICEEKYKIILEEHRAELALQIAIEAMAYSKYCEENIIVKEMFANLWVSCANADQKKITRAFCSKIVKIIKQMNSLEAILFASFNTEIRFYPIYRILSLSSKNRYVTTNTNIFLANGESFSTDIIGSRAEAIASLERLGVIKTTIDKKFSEEKYLHYTNDYVFKELQKIYSYEHNSDFCFKPGILYITPLGTRIWNMCCNNLNLPSDMNVPTSFQ